MQSKGHKGAAGCTGWEGLGGRGAPLGSPSSQSCTFSMAVHCQWTSTHTCACSAILRKNYLSVWKVPGSQTPGSNPSQGAAHGSIHMHAVSRKCLSSPNNVEAADFSYFLLILQPLPCEYQPSRGTIQLLSTNFDSFAKFWEKKHTTLILSRLYPICQNTGRGHTWS